MTDTLINGKRARMFSLLEILMIVCLACVPLFVTFPYRVNIFLSWEGAYRMSVGQIPYKDFGMPLGYMYWVIPSLFFKIFGTQMITLVKAQVFINIISGLAFRSILKSLSVHPGIRLLSVLVYCISFSFFNFWPWYNHTVIVYQMIGLAFLFYYMRNEPTKWSWIWLSLSAFFTFCSFFTKQDGGGLAFILHIVLLSFYCSQQKKWRPLLIFFVSYIVVALAIIAPLLKYNFTYWFNHGQAPHTARVNLFELIDEFLVGSQWIKFYLLIIILFAIAYYKSFRHFLSKKNTSLFLLLTLGILAEAAILQVTSYTPPDNNIFFHSFAIAFILSLFAKISNVDFFRGKFLSVVSALLILWWSSVFWKYIQRMNLFPQNEIASTNENVVNRQTYLLNDATAEAVEEPWVFTNLKSFEKISMPLGTANGIQRLMNSPLVKSSGNIKVLNMSELTPLAVEMPYQLEQGEDIPLWHHLGVGMFNKHAYNFEKKISSQLYDIVLFQYVPSLNNFFPFRVRDSLIQHYHLIDSFPAPRRGNTQGIIEVYTK